MRWIAGLLAVAALSGCTSSVSTPLPELETPSKSVMSSAEQERAIKEMLARKDSHQSKAMEEISKAK